MLGKIKSVAVVFLRGATGGIRGLSGALLFALSVYFLIGLFTGEASVQGYIRNRRALEGTDARIAALQARLDNTNLHIELLQKHSPDFVSEMALKHLNLGDPGVMIVK